MSSLRPFREQDFLTLSRWRNDAEAQRLLMGRGGSQSPDQVRAWLKRRTEDAEGGFWCIEHDGLAGYVQLTDVNRVDGHGKLGLFVDQEFRGRGIAAEALRELEASSRLHKLVLEVLESNTRAVRFYERNGYGAVGVLRAHWKHDGAYHDVRIMEKILP